MGGLQQCVWLFTIVDMRTVGQILKEARESKFYSLEEVEKATKIQKKILDALEKDDYTKLPPPTFVQGFIKNYARFLSLDPQKLLAIFRREFSSEKNRPYVMDAFTKPIKKTTINITPARVLGLVISLLVISFFAYLWLQYNQFAGAPKLSVTSPQDQMEVEGSSVLVEGNTDPEMKVAVNSQDIPVASDGHFKEEVTLNSQVQKLVIVSTNKFGQSTTIERTVYLKR